MAHFLARLVDGRGESFLLRNVSTGDVVATRVDGAFDSATRRRGLLGRAGFPSRRALILAPCAGIHTCFMQFPIDVVFARRNGEVVKVCPAVKPWRAAWASGAFAAIEFAAGAASGAVRPGDKLEVDRPSPQVISSICS